MSGSEVSAGTWMLPRRFFFLGNCMKAASFTSLYFVLFPNSRFHLNTATGCCFAPVQWETGQHVLSADDKPLYPSVPMRIMTNPTVFLSRIRARPTISAGKTEALI